MSWRRYSWFALALGIAAACGSSDDDTSEATPSDDAGSGGSGNDATTTDTSVPNVKRKVFQKNPFGNVTVSNNTLWDGDFEWATEFASQYAWVPVSGLGVGLAPFAGIRASAFCRSGMKCAFMTTNQAMAGIGVSPGGSKVSASIWARPPDGVCDEMTISLISCGFASDDDLEMKDADAAPDAEGWCHYEAISDVRELATCIYVVADFSDGEAIVDDGVIRAAPGDAVPTSILPDREQRARIEQARKTLREYMKPRPATSTRAKEELDRWLERKR
jgi:hypothetical protein